FLDEVGFDLVHVFHARNIGSGAIEEPRLRGLPLVVHLMDFWWVCPNYLLWRRDGSLCDGPPEGGVGCIPCVDPTLQAAIAERRVEPELRSIGQLRTPAGDHSASHVRQGHALIGRKEHLMALLARAHRVIAPSLFLAQIYQRHGLPAEKVIHLAYGLDPERFAHMPPRKPARGKPHLDVGYIGSIARHKGVHVLLDALRHVATPELRVHLHGSRDSQPGFSEALVDGINDARVTFHGPFEPAQLGSVLAALDVLVVPSLWYENTPFSVLEALCAGVPVVASNLGGLAEIVVEGQSGFLFPPGDARKLGAMLESIAADPEGSLALSPPQPPGIDDNLTRLQALYEELLASRPARSA
ncbi:MAG TPA: glycosyltransferase, partial [Planctomycetota bacterium]|nr:glycosyltransferase [Planctomycetota bacterium]